MRNSQSGLSLIEVMIAVSILTIVAVGTASAFSYYEGLVIRQRMNDTLETARTNLFSRLQDDRAWRRTIRNYINTAVPADANPELQCLFNQSDCDPGLAGPAWFMINPASQDSAGLYTLQYRYGVDGQLCDRPVGGYAIVDPDRDLQCPLRFSILGNFNCGGAAACYPNSVEVVMRPVIAADFQSKYGAFQTSVDPVTMRPTGCRYCLNFIRGIASIEQSFTVREEKTNPMNSGRCAIGGVPRQWVIRNFRVFETDSDDLRTSGQVAISWGRVVMKPGRYKCRAQAPGRGVGTFRIRARVHSGNAVINQFGNEAVAFAGMSHSATGALIPQETTAILEFEVRSTDDNPSEIVIEQFCETTRSSQDLGGRFGAIGAINRYSKMECRRLY